MERKSSLGITVKRVPSLKTGPEAMAAIGMPREFAAQLMLLAQTYGVTIAIRASMPEQKYRDAAQPKPSDVKAKTGDWGLTKGVIAEDAELGKHNAKGQPINSGMQHSDRVTSTLHRISLRNILRGLDAKPPTFELMSPNGNQSLQENIAKNKFLLIRCLDAPPGKRDYVYKVDLTAGLAPIEIDTQHINVLHDSSRGAPEWWSQELGNFGEMLEIRLPVECAKMTGQPFTPVKVLAIRNSSTQELLPITGDMDLLWISRPSEQHPFVKEAIQKSIPLLTVMDLSNPENIPRMRTHMQALCLLEKSDPINFNLITDEKLARLGCITPFEAYIITIINQRFAAFVDHLDDLLQHGCENRNPGKASDLDSGMLHCTNGLFTLTTNEAELLNFILSNQDYLQQYRLELNPNWDMGKEKWGRVVHRLLEMNLYELDQKITERYRTATGEDLSAISAGFRKVSRTFSEALGAVRRLSMTADSPPNLPARKNSNTNNIVQITYPDCNDWDDQRSLLGTKSKRILHRLCDTKSNKNEGISWERDGNNVLTIQFKHANGTSQSYQFKIEANSISLVKGELDDNSISIFKTLQNELQPGAQFIVNSLKEENKLILEHHLSPQEPGPRPNSNHQ